MSSASSVCSSISSRYDSGYESSDWFIPDMEDEYVDAWKFVVIPQDFMFELELNANIFKPHIKQHFKRREEIIGDQSSTSPLIPTVAIQIEKDVCPLSPPPSPKEKNPFKPYFCEHCPSTFSRNHDLKRHLRIHLGVRPYTCNTCSKSFTRMDALHRHESVSACKPKEELELKVLNMFAIFQKEKIKKMVSFSFKRDKGCSDTHTESSPNKATPPSSRSPSPAEKQGRKKAQSHNTLNRKESESELPSKDPIQEFNCKTRQHFISTSCNPQFKELIQYTNLLVEIFNNPHYNNVKNRHLLFHIKNKVEEWNNNYEINLECLGEIKEMLSGLEKVEVKKQKYKFFK
ncbi:hypothetical protein HDV01_002514 [Terramyces sp. JEL0728]|nr:hypothetical protein HDV01_002514 [Terramyces sp. JEL0728]